MLNTKNLKRAVIFALIGGTVVAVGAATLYARSAADAERQRDIAEANLVALRDTVTIYSDSLSETTSLMQMQGELTQAQQDSILLLNTTLARAIFERNQSIRSLQTLELRFARLQGEFASAEMTNDSLAAALEEGEELRQFDVAGPPIEGSLWVTYRPQGAWGLTTDLGVSPFAMQYTVGCQDNAPVVNVTTPPWVGVTPERGTVAPDVCNPVKPVSAWSSIFRVDVSNSIWLTLGGIAGYFIRGWVDDGGKGHIPCRDDVCYDRGPSY